MATDNVVPFNGAVEPAPPPAEGSADASSEGKGAKARKSLKPEPDWKLYRALLDRFALIYSTDTVWDDTTGLIMKISAMAHAYGSDYVRMWKAAPSSQYREEGKRWTVLPSDVVFDPTYRCDADKTINLFGGIAMEPKQGDVAPMLELAKHLTSRASPHAEERDEVLHWLMCWLAYPIQRIGAKLRCAVVMHGDEGAGKNFFFETLLEIYGEYGKAVGQDELEDKFNDWRSRTLFVLADEASSKAELVHNKNRLKSLITSPTVQINPKNLPRREEANHMNIAFLSNELTPLALDNTDRRYLVIFTPPAREAEFYKALAKWRRNGGTEAWMHYLKRYPLTDFDPYAPPPMTSAKADLIDLNRKTAERFWVEWSGNELDLPYRTCSVDQAYRAYTRYCLRVGDRYPDKRPNFSRQIVRISESLKKPMRVKNMWAREGEHSEPKTIRMLLVADPVIANGVAEGDWASEAIAAFSTDLGRYMRGARSHDEGDERPSPP